MSSDTVLNTNTPKITIVTVVLNLIKNSRKDVFIRCINSIREQTYPNIEHIVIDGASTDGTIDLLREMNLNFISEKDSGIYDAMNKGIRRATGKYIAFMNSDDYYAHPNAIQDVIDKFLQTNADAVYGKAKIVERLNKKDKQNTYHIGTALYHMPVCHQAFFCTVDSLKRIGLFDTSFEIAADYNSIYQLVLSGCLIVPVNSVTACFSCADGISADIQQSKNESTRVVYDNIAKITAITQEQAIDIINDKYVPFHIYRSCYKKINPAMKKQFHKVYLKQFLRRTLRWLFTIRLAKRNRCIQLFGIRLCRKK